MLGDRAGALAAYRAFLEKTEGDAGFERQREVARQLAARLEASGRP